ncbi:MAG: flavodoxin [SAR324 cluster bacterium]|nr:flavodoxin [SAR324 cluster bacterium]
MKKIGLFYGSTTGNTENAAQKMAELLGKDNVELFDVGSGATIEDVNKFDNLVFGIPTWDIGELQEDWISWVDNLDDAKMNLSGKTFAVFGVGDQDGYPDTFGDAIGIVYDKIVARGGVPVIDKWPIDSYTFDESKGVKDGYFVGMMIDDDAQPELTKKRINDWVHLAKDKFS